MRLVLAGDSHLARVRRDLARLPGPVLNVAVGGATTLDLAAQLTVLAPDDRVAVSVGTNDAAPWKAVPLDRAVAALRAALAPHRVERWLLVTSPGVDEARLGRAADRTNATLSAYGAALGEVVTAAGGSVLDAAALLAPAGPTGVRGGRRAPERCGLRRAAAGAGGRRVPADGMSEVRGRPRRPA